MRPGEGTRAAQGGPDQTQPGGRALVPRQWLRQVEGADLKPLALHPLTGASGHLMASWSYVPKAVPAFTSLLLTLLPSSCTPSLCPNPVHLRKCWCILVSLASLCLQAPATRPSAVHGLLKQAELLTWVEEQLLCSFKLWPNQTVPANPGLQPGAVDSTTICSKRLKAAEPLLREGESQTQFVCPWGGFQCRGMRTEFRFFIRPGERTYSQSLYNLGPENVPVPSCCSESESTKSQSHSALSTRHGR